MNNEIVKTNGNGNGIVTIEEIKRYICPTATDSELNMAYQICKATGLNPYLKEVHLIKYGNSPCQIVTAYTEYIKRAEKSGKLNGWSVKVSDDKKTATCIIHRKDWAMPFEWEVDFNEANKKQGTWNQIPVTMLKKTAISQAFRLCFPEEIASLPYTQEENEIFIQPEVKTITKTMEKVNELKAKLDAPKVTKADVAEVMNRASEFASEPMATQLKTMAKKIHPEPIPEVPAHTTSKINGYAPEHPREQEPDIYMDAPEEPKKEEVVHYITTKQQKFAFALLKESGKNESDFRKFLSEKFGTESTNQIPAKSFEEVLVWIKKTNDQLEF